MGRSAGSSPARWCEEHDDRRAEAPQSGQGSIAGKKHRKVSEFGCMQNCSMNLAVLGG